MRRILVFALVITGACEDEDEMALKQIDIPWGETTTNITTPTDSQIRGGHALNSVANSDWENFVLNRADLTINQALEMAQGASQVAPSADGLDWLRLAGGLHKRLDDGTVFPNSDMTTVDLGSDVIRDACAGKNHETGLGCVYYTGGGSESLRRVNTWAYGGITIDTLDLDIPNVYLATPNGIASDGDYLYTSYGNTVTGNFHIIKLDLRNFTGLPVEERNTGWSYLDSGSDASMSLTLAAPGTIGAFYSPPISGAAQFGVWETDDSSWLTGTGNIGDIVNDVELSFHVYRKVRATRNHLYAVVQEDLGATKQQRFVSCTIADPTTAAYPADPMYGDVTSGNSVQNFVVFSDFLVTLGWDGVMYSHYDDGTSDWNLLNKGNVSAFGLSKDTASIFPAALEVDGSGRLWVLYYLAAGSVNNGASAPVLVAFDPGLFSPYGPSGSLVTRAIVPVGTNNVDGDLQLLWDGRNLVIISGADDPNQVLRVLHNPGAR